MQGVLILDFGSQYTQLIARRLREMQVYCEIWPCTENLKKIKEYGPQALILSGGPASVWEKGAPTIDPAIFDGDIPILGICYGMQLMAKLLQGCVEMAEQREYGPARLKIVRQHILLKGVKTGSRVWMSHGDSIKRLPKDFLLSATSDKGAPAVIIHQQKKIIGLQFHPEVHHSDEGIKILKNFLFGIARVRADWNMHDFVRTECQKIRTQVDKDRVILGLSGGVDSAVAAAVLHRAIGDRLICIFIDNGLLRAGEAESVIRVFKKHFHMRLICIDASKKFLSALKTVTDPERKRKIIGRIFIDVFALAARKLKGVKYLAQGTLYPDVIESVSFKGPSAVIKSHHNVGGLPKNLHFKLIEPLRELFKDEVRLLGRELKLPDEILNRHPFPGPGLGIRLIGEVTKAKLALLRRADAIALEELKTSGWYNKIWQALVVLLPVRSVGVMGDERTYQYTAALRCVGSVDGMTADFIDLPHAVLSRISARIINEVRGINRVVYDISSKPPATIEWE